MVIKVDDSGWFIGIIFLFIGGMYTMSYLEDRPQHQFNIVDTATVIESGCTNGSYKGNITYDCSVFIEWDSGSLERIIVKYGLLTNDRLTKYCGTALWREYECRIGREK